MRTRSFLCLLTVLTLLMCACSSNSASDVEKIELWSSGITNGDYAVPKNRSIIIGIIGRDKAGNSVGMDFSKIEWKSSDNKFLAVQPLGEGCLVTGLRDWFDYKDEYRAYGEEPSAKLNVTYGSAHTEITIKVIINIAGTWNVAVGDQSSKELEFGQQGRSITYAGSSGEQKGTLNGTKVSVQQLGVNMTGYLSSHTEASGTYTGPYDTYGSWKAKLTQQPK